MIPLLPFARFTQLMKAIDALPIPSKIYNQHRMEYDYILGQVSIAFSRGKALSVGDLTSCTVLGSQPTVNKRIQELIKYQLIEVQLCEDRRIKLLRISPAGERYLASCSDLMKKVISQAEQISNA
jgi:DNA-binding MarR family transcriptional regulator